jgi:hypothetical protein
MNLPKSMVALTNSRATLSVSPSITQAPDVGKPSPAPSVVKSHFCDGFATAALSHCQISASPAAAALAGGLIDPA